MNQYKQVWSPFIRFFHWTLVIAFVIAFLSGESEFSEIHNYSGYYLAALVVFRIIVGFVSKGHASFSDFVYSFRDTLNYVKLLVQGKAPHYLGHNPLGGWMVLAILTFLSLTVISGLILLGIEEYSGPLYFLADWPYADYLADSSEEVHEFTSYAILPLIFLHILGVIFTSLHHKENLVKAMFTGKKKVSNTSNQKAKNL